MSETPAVSTDHPLLFDPSEIPTLSVTSEEPELHPIHNPVWTDNKARLIMHYLHYFVLLTKHGTYIDGFAGPQEECQTNSWAAKLVLASEPRWIRHFHLCDVNRHQVERLKELEKSQPAYDKSKKIIDVSTSTKAISTKRSIKY